MERFQAGFIGCGNMGGVLAEAAAKSGASVAVTDHHPEKTAVLARKCAAVPLESAVDAARQSTFLVVGVKPQSLSALAEEIREALSDRLEKKDRFVLVSMAAGVSMANIELSLCGGQECCPVIRIMPNLPAAVGEGEVLYCVNPLVTGTEEEAFRDLFRAAGDVVRIDENKIDAASAVTGCGPAFVCLFMEALTDGAVRCGLPRGQAERFVWQTVLGTAKMCQETGQDPALLRAAVCSPGGSTIAGVAALEQGAVRYAAMEAVRAAWERTCELGRK